MKEFFKRLFKQDDVSIAIQRQKDEYRNLAKEQSAAIKRMDDVEQAIKNKKPFVEKPEKQPSVTVLAILAGIKRDERLAKQNNQGTQR